MRRLLLPLLIVGLTFPLDAQPRRVRRPVAPGRAQSAEMAAKDAAQALAAVRKIYENDLVVLRHLRAADDALADPMQPNAAVQKAFEEVSAAEGLSSDFLVVDGVIHTRQALEEARRSPGTADFGRLRGILRDRALVPASRVAVRNAMALEEEIQAWIKVQVLIADHLRQLSELSSESLRASERE